VSYKKISTKQENIWCQSPFFYLANSAMMKKIQAVCAANGFECPQLLTPLQLLGGHDVD
jgi:nucleoside 2-deoxyribosyltransferase